MDSTPLIKRRKLNAAVNKPFKSPLKTSSDQKATPRISSPLTTVPVKNVSDDIARDERIPSAVPSVSQATPLKRNHLRTSIGKPGPSGAPQSPSDPVVALEIQNASRAIRALESKVTKTRQDIDTLNQALHLATSNKDAELDDLAIKWRKAAREAAEEVFAGARDKVNRMGGVGAWRERQREMEESNSRWNEPIKQNDDEEEIYDEAGELVEVRKIEREERFDDEWEYDAEAKKEQKQEEGRDDDSFTMDMMLKMLNIDLALIGYDKKHQRWVG